LATFDSDETNVAIKKNPPISFCEIRILLYQRVNKG
jgi:hypothetical protein